MKELYRLEAEGAEFFAVDEKDACNQLGDHFKKLSSGAHPLCLTRGGRAEVVRAFPMPLLESWIAATDGAAFVEQLTDHPLFNKLAAFGRPALAVALREISGGRHSRHLLTLARRIIGWALPECFESDGEVEVGCAALLDWAAGPDGVGWMEDTAKFSDACRLAAAEETLATIAGERICTVEGLTPTGAAQMASDYLRVWRGKQ